MSIRSLAEEDCSSQHLFSLIEVLGYVRDCDKDAVEQLKASPAQDEEHQSQLPASQEGLQREARDLQVKQPVRPWLPQIPEPRCHCLLQGATAAFEHCSTA